MQLKAWYLLSKHSKKALLRTKKRWGHNVVYSPRGNLINRLSVELGMDKQSVIKQLNDERNYLLEYSKYFR